MPHRRLVKIGEPVNLPTISQFLAEMATRQHEEIQRLKSEALSGVLPDPTVPEEHHETLTPDPWQLHPVRIRKSASKKAKSSKSSKVPKRKATKAKKAVKPKKVAKSASKPRSKKKPAKKVSAKSSRR
jgi:hypothetical protein